MYKKGLIYTPSPVLYSYTVIFTTSLQNTYAYVIDYF